jgi:hypothetical protein
MLIEIRSDRLRIGSIQFHEGLNVVLGDEKATNSIGKSSLLMIIDFVFGGTSFLDHNRDAIEVLGDHDYFFAFQFDGSVQRFRRGTFRADLVFRCDENYDVGEPMEIEGFRAFLKASYRTPKHISFRNLVGLYSRIWGKENLNVHKPLHVAQAQSSKDCVQNLIKTFDRYDEIADLVTNLQTAEKTSEAFKKAFDSNVIARVGAREYGANVDIIGAARSEIDQIKENLARFSMSISEIANRDVLELKQQKDELLAMRLEVESKLRRVQENLASNRHIKSRHFESLLEFFPTINKERLLAIEEFHSQLSRILKSELISSESELAQRRDTIQQELDSIDVKLAASLSSIKSPGIIVDRVVALAEKLQRAEEENHYRDASQEVSVRKKELGKELVEKQAEALSWIQDYLNDTMQRIVTSIFGTDRKSPEIELRERSYSFRVFEDTGTGTAYSSLIVFDLAVFQVTSLPCIAHDSLLFKNIENDSVINLLHVYRNIDKQSFIAIDEAGKYGEATASILRALSVIHLDDRNVLFIKNWRNRDSTPSGEK